MQAMTGTNRKVQGTYLEVHLIDIRTDSELKTRQPLNLPVPPYLPTQKLPLKLFSSQGYPLTHLAPIHYLLFCVT